MAAEENISPAEQASIECLQRVFQAIDDNLSFRVEAGAGAGKTYTLIKALKHLIGKYSLEFQRTHKKIACITYTNVAKDEIRSRTDNHPIIVADTIHAFAWEIIKSFQQPLRERIHLLSDRWVERIAEVGGINKQKVIYDLGYPKLTETEIYLHHNDVIKLFTLLIEEEKFRTLLSDKFPIILIDEYQDTNRELANALVDNFIQSPSNLMLGFFGDAWQKIYGSDSCGLIEADADKMAVIGKQANFRSDRNIVTVLNRMRPDLEQFEYDPDSEGEVVVFHTNNWNGERRTGAHWNGDLPADVAHDVLENLKNLLNENGWNISSENTKVLMLTNNVLASEQGYSTIASTFSDNDDYLKMNDPYIDFFVNVAEIGFEAYEHKQYGKMFNAFGIRTPRIRKHSDKQEWQDGMTALSNLRNEGSVGQVVDLLKVTKKPRLSNKIEEREQRLSEVNFIQVAERNEDDARFADRLNALRAIPYYEIPNLSKYIDNKTLYSTKHGVKGAEFENVIVVLGRGWNQYNWNQFLEFVNSGNIPADKVDFYERNRNLFYVACSRPKNRLCLLFTQHLSAGGLAGLATYFGDAIHPMP